MPNAAPPHRRPSINAAGLARFHPSVCPSSLPPCGAIGEPPFHGSKSRGPERLTAAPNHIAWAVAASRFEAGAHFLRFLTPWQRLCGTRRENLAAEEPGAGGSRHFTHPGSRLPSRCAAHAGGRQGPGRKRSPAATRTPWSARLARRGLSGRARALRPEPPAPPRQPRPAGGEPLLHRAHPRSGLSHFPLPAPVSASLEGGCNTYMSHWWHDLAGLDQDLTPGRI